MDYKGQPAGNPPPPPPPGYSQPPPQYGQHSTTVITAGMPVVAHCFRETSVPMQCPYCHANITTTTTYETGTLTWVICGVLILFGLWLGCCLIPFCIDGCKDVIHSCPNCHQTVGKFNRM
ncbi:LITAF domain-containing protein-like [Crassostrea angulata]|uniref:LITAF domain-containing protein n=1 Tax=Magallana gigas TaxID=29159 RepID=K1QHE1_MAGGI|nr:lipopolysaccharide-induced tumor necrosis factor-alpha factor homolog [Crassostrea gigas]XP_052689533.1 LITAF domain-containing protein-like [Crassostrea angulata]